MAVDAAVPTRAGTRSFARARLLAYPVRLALAGVVALSFAVHSLLAQLHVVPYYLPDEYLYPTLARSLATTGRPLVRGSESHFPALLQPILTAPFQLFDPHTAYRLTQLFDALAMSAAAIPVYLIARRLRLSPWYAVGCAAVAVVAPSMLYAGFMLADPVAYPLALTAVYLGLRALDTPTRNAQLAFLACAGVATFARTQYIVLPFVFALAALALERRGALRTYRVTGAAIALCVLAVLAVGPSRAAGIYSGATQAHFSLGGALLWAGRDAVLLAYSAGWVLVPGALVALATARGRVERAYSLFFGALTCALVAEAAVVAGLDSDRFQERYLIALVPLIPVAFGVYLRRGAPHRKAVGLLAAALLLFAARVPLSGYAAQHGKDDSPLLYGVLRIEQWFGVGSGGLMIALAAGVLSLVAIAIAWRPRFAAAGGLALTVLALACVSVGAYSYDQLNARAVRHKSLPDNPSWVDATGLRDVALLEPPNSEPQRTWHQLLWNRSITDVLLLGPKRLDGYRVAQIGVANDGRILVGGRTLKRPLLVQTAGSRATFSGATKIATGKDFELWKPRGIPRLALLAGGWYDDGWLAWRSFVSVWPDASGRVEGTLTLRMGMPLGTERTPLTLKAPGYERTVVLVPGHPRAVRVSVSWRGPWTVRLSTPQASYAGLRSVSVRGLSPEFERRRGAHLAPSVPAAAIV